MLEPGADAAPTFHPSPLSSYLRSTCSKFGVPASHVPGGGNPHLLGPVPAGSHFLSSLLLLRTFPRNGNVNFLQFLSLYWGGNGTPEAEPCFQSKPTPWAGRKIPKMEKNICPRPGPAPLQPKECVSRQCPGSGMEAWEGCDRAGSELPHPRAWLLMCAALGSKTLPQGGPFAPTSCSPDPQSSLPLCSRLPLTSPSSIPSCRLLSSSSTSG